MVNQKHISTKKALGHTLIIIIIKFISLLTITFFNNICIQYHSVVIPKSLTEDKRKNPQSNLILPDNAVTTSSAIRQEEQCSLFLEVLDSGSFHACRKTLFSSRNTMWIPDLFFILLFILITISSTGLDRLFLYLIMIQHDHMIWGAIYFMFMLLGSIAVVTFQCTRNSYRMARGCPDTVYSLQGKIGYPLHITLLLLGLDSIVIGSRVVYDAFRANVTLSSKEFPIFQASDAHISTIRSFCLVSSIVKGIPHMYITQIFLLTSKPLPLTKLIATSIMLINLVILSLTITMSLPLRSKSLVLRTNTWWPLIVLVRFNGCMSLTASHLQMVRIFYQSLGPFSFLVHYASYGLALLVAVRILQPVCKSPLVPKRVPYSAGLALIYTIIFIHPIEDFGELWYMFFYLFKCVFEMGLMYVIGLSSSYTSVATYYALFMAGVGLLGLSFALTLVFHKSFDEVDNIKHLESNDQF